MESLNRSALSQELSQLHADFCSALADQRRLLLLYSLAEGPRNVGQLTEDLAVSQPSVSRHLKLLRERGLVDSQREGANVVYSLTDRRVIEALDLLRSVMRDQWTHRADLMTAAAGNELDVGAQISGEAGSA